MAWLVTLLFEFERFGKPPKSPSAAGLLFLTPVFEKLPNNALAAIVVAGLVSIFDYEEAVWLWKVGNLPMQHIPRWPRMAPASAWRIGTVRKRDWPLPD
jgi:hypothetical protein